MTNATDVAGRFDDVLRNMAGQAGSLEALLGVFFSFLHRNTDFYVTYDPATTLKAGMGFPVGKAEQLLIKAFRSLPFKPYEGIQAQSPRDAGGSSTKTKVASRSLHTGKQSTAGTPGRLREDKSNSSSKSQPDGSRVGTSGGAIKPRVTATPTPAHPPPPSQASSPSSILADSTKNPSSRTPETSASESGAAPTGGVQVRYTEDGKQVPIGNGGVTPRYYWTQTIGEATVYVDVPPGTRSKDVTCVIEPRKLKLVVKGAGGETGGASASSTTMKGGVTDVLIEGELPSAVSREDSMWSLIDGKAVVISFEKATRSWWKSVVEGDPEIDTTQVTEHTVKSSNRAGYLGTCLIRTHSGWGTSMCCGDQKL